MPKRRSIKTSSPSDFEPKRKNPISLGSDSNIDNDLKPLKIGGETTPFKISKDTVEISSKLLVNGKQVQTGTDSGATQLSELSDVTYSSGDLTISSLDKIITSGNLTFEIGSGTNFTHTNASILNLLTRNDTGSSTHSGFKVDANVSGTAGLGSFPQTVGFEVDLDDTGSHNAGSLPFNYGFRANVAGNSSGTSYSYGAQLVVTGADNQYGVAVITDDSAGGFDFFASSNADSGDYFGIKTITHGATTISTADDNATAAHLTIQPDGDLLLQPTSENIKIPGDVKLIFGTNSANDHIYADPDAGEIYVAMNDSDVMTFHDDKVDVGVQLETNEIMITEAASAVADRAGKGQIWVKNDTPNNLYFTNDAGNDVQITNGSSLAGGSGGSSNYHIFFGARGRCQYNNWYGSNTAYGFAYYFWSQTTGSASVPTSWSDDRHPNHIVPYAGTITGYTIIGNNSTGDTVEWALLKGTGVTHGSAGNYTLSQVGATQSAGGTSNIQYKWEQTGLSVSVAKNDILMLFFRRTTDNDSSYMYNEFSYNILIEAS